MMIDVFPEWNADLRCDEFFFFFSLLSLFNGILTVFGLLNTKISLISKCLITTLIIFFYISSQFISKLHFFILFGLVAY